MERPPVVTQPQLARRLHPRLRRWFRDSFSRFTHAQLLAVPPILDQRSVLLTSPTGSGKTLAGFLGVFDFLLWNSVAGVADAGAESKRRPRSASAATAVQCIYISPLRALAYDIEKNLRAPIRGLSMEKKWRVHLRTGDTSASERARFRTVGLPDRKSVV